MTAKLNNKKSAMKDSNTPKRITLSKMRFTQSKMTLFALMSFFTLSLILATVGIVLAVQTSNNHKENAPAPSSSTTVEKTQRSVTGKTADEDRKDALAAAQEVLNLAAQSPTNATPTERVNALGNGDESVINPELKNHMRFVDTFAENKNLQINSYQALITLTTYLSKDGQSIQPVSENSWKRVYVDSEAGSAYVPMGAFYDKGMVFSVEMVYTDGQWKLSPYSLLDIVRLSALLQSGKSN